MKKLFFYFVLLIGFLSGFLICLLFSAKASKLWVAEEDIRRSFYFELKAVEMYNYGNISAARDNIIAASALTNNKAKRNEWSLFAPLFIFILSEPDSRENYNKCLLEYLDKIKEYKLDSYDLRDYCSILGRGLFENGIGEVNN